MFLVASGENAANVYGIILHEMSFPLARFHQKSKKPMTALSKDLLRSIQVKFRRKSLKFKDLEWIVRW